MRLILYVGIGMAIAYAIGRLLSRKKAQEAAKVAQREATLNSASATNDVRKVMKGGVLRLPPFGQSPLPIETHVTTRHRYSDGDDVWYELVCQHGRRELLVEWSIEGGELYVTGGFEDENPTMEDLGLTEDDLIRIDDAERGEFTWDGLTWRYETSGERDYFENDGRSREGYYGWKFVDDAGGRSVCFEKWEDEAKFYIYHAWMIDARAIEVFDGGDL